MVWASVVGSRRTVGESREGAESSMSQERPVEVDVSPAPSVARSTHAYRMPLARSSPAT